MGALPETVVIEVEPAETAVGLGFSEEVGGPSIAFLRWSERS